jgi:TRAP-type C4-dicarboxylate transport system substrate-binding protein
MNKEQGSKMQKEVNMPFIRNGSKISRTLLLFLIAVALLFTLACSKQALVSSPSPTSVSSTSPASTSGSVAPQFHWRFQCAYAEADVDYQITVKRLAALIEKVSDGQIKVDTYPVGALVAPEEMFSAARDGTIEMGYDMTGAEAEIVPTDYCTSLPGSAENLEEYYDLIYRSGLLDIFRQDFANKGIFLLGINLGGPDCLRATFNLDSWDAIKGKKGWANPQVVDVLTKLGGVCVEVPGYDMYSAMKLGTIEWHGWTLAELETLGWKEVTKSVLLDPIMKIASNDIYLNLKAWQALSPDLQTKISDEVIHHTLDWGLEYHDYDLKAIAASKAYGVKMVTMSAADKAKFLDLCHQEWDTTFAKKSDLSAQCVKIYEDWLKKEGRY